METLMFFLGFVANNNSFGRVCEVGAEKVRKGTRIVCGCF
jgi:hypothetical protein